MKPEDIEQMKRDREAGTPGPWRLEQGTTLIWGDCDADDLTTRGMGYPIAEAHRTKPWSVAPFLDGEPEANARRIARAPTLEAEVLRLREALEWQPRETMPDDETEVLMWHRDLCAAVHPASRAKRFRDVTHWKRVLPPDEPSEGESP